MIRFLRLPDNPDLPLPAYASAGAAGFDFRAAVAGPVVLPPGGRALIPLGFACAVPSGSELQIRPRSGLAANHGVTVLNAPGTVDSDYRGPLMACLINHGTAPFTIARGDRVAQGVVATAPQVMIAEVDALDDTARGSGGFGSTGHV